MVEEKSAIRILVLTSVRLVLCDVVGLAGEGFDFEADSA